MSFVSAERIYSLGIFTRSDNGFDLFMGWLCGARLANLGAHDVAGMGRIIQSKDVAKLMGSRMLQLPGSAGSSVDLDADGDGG
ncbi:MAG: hypothetical protein LCH26_08545 [Proteobacteria bacterium]|nr:hypothetical protein [Pseudomonadota bacterium]